MIWPWKAGNEHLKPERKKCWLFFYSHRCYTANDYQQGNQRQECAHTYNSWRTWWGFASTAKLYLKRKFILLINITNCVPGFNWHSAYHSQQERATASAELPEEIAKKTGQESSRIIIGYRKLLLTFALEAKGAVSLDWKFPTTLFLPELQHAPYPTHTPQDSQILKHLTNRRQTCSQPSVWNQDLIH